MLQHAAIDKVYKILMKRTYGRISVYRAPIMQITSEIGFLKFKRHASFYRIRFSHDTILTELNLKNNSVDIACTIS